MAVGHRGPKQATLAQLRVFAVVAEQLHFRDAAAAIGMSQPALSGAVSALEEALGVRLLERTTRKVLLTPAGERIAVRARAVLDAMGGLLEEAEAVRAPFTGALRFGVIPTVAPYLLPTVLGLFHRRYPRLDLQVHEEQTASLLEGLAGGRLDLLLLAVPLGVPGVTELPLFDEDFVLLAPRDHPLAGRKDIPREELRGLRLLLLDEGHCLRDQALDICHDAGRVAGADVTTTAAGLSTLVQLVAGGSASRCCRAPRCAWRPPATSSWPPGTSPNRRPPGGSRWPCGRERPAKRSSAPSPTPCAKPYARSPSG